MVYLWYSKSTSVTGKALANALGLSRTSPTSSDREYGTLPPPVGQRKIICWGARTPMYMTPRQERRLKSVTYLNNPFDSDDAKNKYNALCYMYSKDVSVPEFVDICSVHDRVDSGDLSFPLVGRKFHHQGGSGFEFIEDEMSLRHSNSDYFMEYIDGEDKREYRVHVFKGEIIKVQRKKPMLDEDGDEIEPTDYRCRSHHNGWRFAKCDLSRVHETVANEAIKAVNALSMDFGAVDIIRVPSTDTTVVLEVNSGMGLDFAGLELYTQLFERWSEST